MKVVYPQGPDSLSPDFAKAGSDIKNGVSRVVIALGFYMIVYILLLVMAGLLAASFAMLGWYIITIKIHYGTLLFGGGLIVTGAMILYFLIKFIFENKSADRPGSLEVTEAEQPELFEFIARISEECGTEFPKHIYLSGDVNAAVFYDSSIKSLVLPVKKNLVIGLGLVNMLNLSEFKAVIAHEFGHFSQKSLRAGSYVYVANRVIYNMLYDNRGYGNILEHIANVHGILAFFVNVTVKIVQGIQWVQQQAYKIVNKQYNYLSRQMEFHADAIAASVAGGNNLNHALQLIEFGNTAYRTTLGQYSKWYEEGIKATNVYRDQRTSAKYTALANKLPLKNELPVFNAGTHYAQSFRKVNIEDQWASHPTNEQREVALDKLNAVAAVVETPAWELFRQREDLERKFTNELYVDVKWKKSQSPAPDHLFEDEERQAQLSFELPEFYNGYYTGRPITKFGTEHVNVSAVKITDVRAFLQHNAPLGRKRADAEVDIAMLNYITHNSKQIKKFNFDGSIYKAKMAETIKVNLENEAKKIDEQIADNDKLLFAYFCQAAGKKGDAELVKEGYNFYFALLQQLIDSEVKFGTLLTDIRPYYNGDEFTDIYKSSPQDMSEYVSRFKRLYREFKQVLDSHHPGMHCAMPEKVVDFMENQLPVLNDKKCTSQTVDAIYQRSEELQYWGTEALINVKKQLLVLQLNYV